MAGFSDLAFQAAMAGYLIALICYGIEVASRRGLVPTAMEAASAQRVHLAKVGAAGSRATGSTVTGYTDADVDDELDDDDDDDDDRAALAPWGVRFGRAAVVVTVIGVLANLLSVVTRGIAAGRLPLGNMYEFVSMICLASVTCWLVVLAKNRAPGLRQLGLFVLIPVVILAFVAGTKLWIPAGPVPPSLNSYWKWIHVTTVSLSGSVLLVSGAASVLYVLRHRFDRKLSEMPDDEALATSVWSRMPSLPTLDKIAYRTAIVAFPVYTFAIIAGALWAEVAWGRYWGWDPKETVAFVSWVFYAGYLHARATSGWRGLRSAWINIIGFAAIVFNLFFVNMVVSGLHSYAGVG
ncbi:c-type cytochrome biogenesis protein CcsB [Nakamurella lactea]|uniref:c-type cytochrome biogenesis protein CcsB n=1 Tax=Nakamurella lactea TaxID=459515 RepID=UPI0004023DD5|nr:c-type cytochrome biogenesis protein CcsB [Nakamurella lactea]